MGKHACGIWPGVMMPIHVTQLCITTSRSAARLLHPRKHQAEAALGAQALQQVCNVIAPFLRGLTSWSLRTECACAICFAAATLPASPYTKKWGASASTLSYSATFDSKLAASPAAPGKESRYEHIHVSVGQRMSELRLQLRLWSWLWQWRQAPAPSNCLLSHGAHVTSGRG